MAAAMALHHRSPGTQVRPYDSPSLAEAAQLLRAGEAVAVPTETVYGLAADATDAMAVAGIYAAKGRPAFNPLIVHVADMDMARRIATFSALAERLATAFWPGPLTLVLPRRTDSGIADLATAGLPTIALRMPAHPAMLALIRATGRPLAAPSANRSGSISPTRAAHVLASLGGRIPLILDAGPTADGLESTIVAPEESHVRLLRPGPIAADRVADVARLPIRRAAAGTVEAPGQLASHYAPAKPLHLDRLRAGPDEYLIGFGLMPCQINLSEEADLRQAAARLFAALHTADASPAAAIAVAPIPEEGIGVAINDRLRRAAAT
jgi:L-threonylcarbamoyladenylate synthase